MDSSKETYLVISDKNDPTLEMGQAIRSTTGTASNFRKAYDLALSIGEIKEPDLGYRTALERTNRSYACRISDKDGSSQVTIALIKKY